MPKSPDSISNKSGSHHLKQELLEKVIDGSSIPIFVINSAHKVVYWNTAMAALSGIRKEVVQGTDGHWRAFYRRKRPTMADLIVDGASRKKIKTMYGEKCKKSALIDGAYEAEDFFPEIGKQGKWIRFTASPIRGEGRVIFAVIETLEDVTQRKTAEENLRYHLKAITRAQEEERKRIARELHDDTVQMLGSLSRQLDTFMRQKNGFKASETRFLNGILQQINNGAQSVHRFSQELRLSVLDDFGLIAALRSLVKELQVRNGIKAELKINGEAKRYPAEVETMLFRIVQEAVSNIGKHSQATEASVGIEFGKERIQLVISDNGKGFNQAGTVDALPRKGKLGLAGIQERARLLGGDIHVNSSPGKGTRLSVEIPLS